MQQELSQYISSLLYQNDHLNIPGFGSFQLAHEPAMIDQVQGLVAPPAKKIGFNANLVMDDGLLVAYISEQKKISVSAAQGWVEKQVEALKVSLDKREIVEIEGVGRFFINFENQLKFVEIKENFNAESFGLKSVTALPVPRSAATTATAPKTTSTTSTAKEVSTKTLTKYLPWVIGGSLILIAVLSAFLLSKNTPETPDPANGLPEERLNASPTKAPDEDVINAADPIADPDKEQAIEMETEGATLSPVEHSAVIAVGLYSNTSNAEKVIQQLFSEGFEGWSSKENGNTRVGVQFRYETEEELQATLKLVQQKFERGAFILLMDGEQVE